MSTKQQIIRAARQATQTIRLARTIGHTGTNQALRKVARAIARRIDEIGARQVANEIERMSER